MWTKGTLWAILRNPIYIGTLVFAKARYSEIGRKREKLRRPQDEWSIVENAVPAIVPRPLWTAAQQRHGTRRFGVGRPYHRPYLLSTLIRCASCGKHYQGKQPPREGRSAYYCCGGRLASGPSVCTSPSVPTAYLDDAVIDGLAKRIERVLDRDELRRRLAPMLTQDCTSALTASDIEARLRETEQRISRLVEALAGGTEALPSVRSALVGLEQERDRLGRELAAARARAQHGAAALDGVVDELVAAVERLRSVLDGGLSRRNGRRSYGPSYRA